MRLVGEPLASTTTRWAGRAPPENGIVAAMFRTLVLLASCLVLTGCGEAPMGASEDAAPPADAPAATPAEAEGADYSGDIDIIGTEPFWSVRIRADGITLTRPDHPELRNANPGARLEGEQGVWPSRGGQGQVAVRLTPGVCSDGMSDRTYRFFAEILVDGETLKGCADHADRLKAQPAP